MGARSGYAPGTFCWVDLGTTDPGAAAAFYGRLLGWESEEIGGGYLMQRLGGADVAGIYVTSFGRMAALTDPQGAVLALWQAGEHIGARLVNDPGALCLNQLTTSDPAAASEFYASEDLDASAATIADAGGAVVVPPMAIQSGRILVARDPQGADVALFEGDVDP